MRDYRVSVIDSFSAWRDLSEAWDELLAKSGAGTVFLTWEWLYSWSECYLGERRKLFILTVYDKDALVGIAPWCVRHVPLKVFTLKQIESLGGPEAGSDYLDVIIKRGKEREVALCIYDFLTKEMAAHWDRLNLRDIPSDSLFLLHFLARVESEGKYAEIRRESFCPIVDLATERNSLLSQTSPHRRQRFSRDLRVLHKEGGIEHHSVSSGGGVDRALADFLAFYRERKGLHDDRLSLLLGKYLSRCGGEKAIEIDLLKARGRIIAGLLHLRYRDTLSLYLMATDKGYNNKISIGNVLVGLCIERAMDRGLSVYDFLKGSEHYKFHWAGGGRSSLTLSLPQRGVVPVLFILKSFLTYTAKVIFR